MSITPGMDIDGVEHAEINDLRARLLLQQGRIVVALSPVGTPERIDDIDLSDWPAEARDAKTGQWFPARRFFTPKI